MGGFEWDDEKNATNFAKHWIRFEEAATIWAGPVVTGQDEAHESEVREVSFGLIGGTTCVCVSYTLRGMKRHASSARERP